MNRKIPNQLVFAGMITALLSNSLLPDGYGFISALKGMGLGFVLFLPLYLLRAMGAGDVKLMAMVGSFLGSQHIVGAVLCTLLAGGVLAVLFALKLQAIKQLITNLRLIAINCLANSAAGSPPSHKEKIGSVGSLPYALAISSGTAGYLIWNAL